MNNEKQTHNGQDPVIPVAPIGPLGAFVPPYALDKDAKDLPEEVPETGGARADFERAKREAEGKPIDQESLDAIGDGEVPAQPNGIVPPHVSDAIERNREEDTAADRKDAATVMRYVPAGPLGPFVPTLAGAMQIGDRDAEDIKDGARADFEEAAHSNDHAEPEVREPVSPNGPFVPLHFHGDVPDDLPNDPGVRADFERAAAEARAENPATTSQESVHDLDPEITEDEVDLASAESMDASDAPNFTVTRGVKKADPEPSHDQRVKTQDPDPVGGTKHGFAKATPIPPIPGMPQ